MQNTYLIRNVKVYDGLGNKPYTADVLLKDGKIAKIAKDTGVLPDVGGVIDGTGLCLAPGFIDAHTHSDRQVLTDPGRAGRLLQGITSEIGGQCSSFRAPYLKSMPADARKFVNTELGEGFWFETFDEALKAVDKIPLGCNQKYFVGHKLLRLSVLGLEPRAATDKEIDRMCGLAEEAMQSGALGLSTGLVYTPGPYAETKEIIALAKTVGKYGGIYTTHIRNEAGGVEQAIAEAIEIGRKAEVPVNISHIKNMFPANWDKTDSILKQLDDALAEGIDVTCDAYPYEACSANIMSTLPPSYRAKGIDWMVEELSGEKGRARLKDVILQDKENFENPILGIGFENVLVVSAAATPEAEGRRIAEYAELKGLDGFDAWCDIIVKNEAKVTDCRFAMKDENIIRFYQHPRCMVGSDGLYSGDRGLCHPRFFATMTRYLGRYVRDKKILPFEEGIRRMTSMTAERYGLKGKGVIKEGYDADLVLFNENTIIDRATFMDPFLPNEGIKAVFVGGGIAAMDNVCTGLANGKMLRR